MALVLCKRVGILWTRFSRFSFGEDSFGESSTAEIWVFQAWIGAVGGLDSFFYRVIDGVCDRKYRMGMVRKGPYRWERSIPVGVVDSRRRGNNGKVLARLEVG